MPHEAWQDIARGRLHDHLMMLCSKIACHHTGICKLRVCGFLKTDRKGLYGPLRKLCHQGNDDTGIDATTQKSSYRDVTQQTTLDSLDEELPQVFDHSLLIRRLRRRVHGEVPIGAARDLPVVYYEHMP